MFFAGARRRKGGGAVYVRAAIMIMYSSCPRLYVMLYPLVEEEGVHHGMRNGGIKGEEGGRWSSYHVLVMDLRNRSKKLLAQRRVGFDGNSCSGSGGGGRWTYHTQAGGEWELCRGTWNEQVMVERQKPSRSSSTEQSSSSGVVLVERAGTILHHLTGAS